MATPEFLAADRVVVHCFGTWRCLGHSEQALPMARSGGAELRQDSRPEQQEADWPVLAHEVLLRHRGRAGYHRALLVFRASAQVACSAFLAEPTATLRPVER
jgi:hypothetical protein